MSLQAALEEAVSVGKLKPKDMTPLEMVQYLEKRALELPKVLDHLQWVCQTIHQAYHPEQPGTWIVCPKSICESTVRLFTDLVNA